MNFITKKIPAAHKFPTSPPPITFLMVRLLACVYKSSYVFLSSKNTRNFFFVVFDYWRLS